MELRNSDPYVSCIKIRGVPIIPPLMTEDLRTEMRYYKHLALAVEEKLKKLEILECSEQDSTSDKAAGKNILTMETGSSLENEDTPGLADVSDTPKCSESISDGDASSRPDDLAVGENVETETITASTDLNQYMNDSFESEAMISTMDNSPETKKPEVPKTLDIVPITVDATVPLESIHPDAQDSASTITTITGKTTTSPQSDETTPKLVRQGSYILDSPSPMLLAHLREGNTPIDDYVPTSNNNGSKRKQWNISEARSEWELQKMKDTPVVTDSFGKQPQDRRIRRNSTSGAVQTKWNRPASQTKTGGKFLGQTRQIARSADCIRSMVSRENATRRSKDSSISTKNARLKESSAEATILNLANKLGGSLGSLSSPTIRSSSKRTTPQKRTNLSRSSKSFDDSASSRIDGLRGSTKKLLSTVTSEKLVDVFKEIQRAHERQMNDLVARQQREQREMQKEFEKQQVLLLAQIEQTFPGICLPKLAEKLATPTPSPILRREEIKENLAPLPQRVEMNGCHSPEHHSAVKCPLDDIYPRQAFQNISCQRIKNVNNVPSQPIDAHSPSFVNGQRKNNGVSRELFPLESETSHVPVLNNVIYEEKHIKAATIVNAYARGYLVRRIMQTERVIALKTTYGEALRCMLKLHVDAPLALPELNFHQRLQLQCDAASMNIVELFAQEPAKRMEIIKQDRQIKRARQERPNSARSCYSFATQRTLARKKLKEMGDFEKVMGSRTTTARSRCQTWASNAREKRSPSLMNQGIKRSTSAGAVRKPWR